MADRPPWTESAASDVAAHSALTHGIHGIADTALLARLADIPDVSVFQRADRMPVIVSASGGDDTVAINNAITTLNAAGGGHIWLVDREYVAHGINLDNTNKVSLIGRGDRQGGTRILSHSAGATAVVSARSASGGVIDGLRIENDNAAYTGTPLDFTRDPLGANDTTLIDVDRCYLRAVAQAGSAVVLCRTSKAWGITFARTRFYGGAYGIRGRESAAGGDFSNSVVVERNCLFEQQDVAPIHNPWIWRVENVVFEPRRGGTAAAILSVVAVRARSLLVAGVWTGDASAAGIWFDVNGDDLTFLANHVDIGGTGIRINAASTGLTALGNRFNGLTNGIDFNGLTVAGTVLAGNRYPSTTNPIVGNSFGLGSLVIDSDVSLVRTDADTIQLTGADLTMAYAQARITINALTAASQFILTARQAGDTQDRFALQGNGTMNWGPGNAVTDTGLQRSGAGALKAINDFWIGGKVGFYGTVPQNKPAATGSRGGNAALASLLTQLAALGLITDSTTA